MTVRRSLAAGFAGLLLLAGCSSSSDSEPDAAGSAPPSCATTTAAAPTGLAGGGGECLPAPTSGTASGAPATSRSTSRPATPPATSTPPPAPQEVEGDCPYLTRQEASNLEGNMVGRVTIVTTDPVGCNFYFAYGDGHMVLQISTQRFADPIDAYNAMVRLAQANTNADPFELADGAVLFQTGFYDVDAAQDWAAAFVKGGLLVVVNTDQKSPSYNARAIAETIAPLIA